MSTTVFADAKVSSLLQLASGRLVPVTTELISASQMSTTAFADAKVGSLLQVASGRLVPVTAELVSASQMSTTVFADAKVSGLLQLAAGRVVSVTTELVSASQLSATLFTSVREATAAEATAAASTAAQVFTTLVVRRRSLGVTGAGAARWRGLTVTTLFVSADSVVTAAGVASFGFSRRASEQSTPSACGRYAVTGVAVTTELVSDFQLSTTVFADAVVVSLLQVASGRLVPVTTELVSASQLSTTGFADAEVSSLFQVTPGRVVSNVASRRNVNS